MKRLVLGIVLILFISTNSFAKDCFADKNGKEPFKIGIHLSASDTVLKLPTGTIYKDSKTISVTFEREGDNLNYNWKELKKL
jgi:hypothetical protein